MVGGIGGDVTGTALVFAIEDGGCWDGLPPLEDGSLTFAVITELTSVTWLFTLRNVLKPSTIEKVCISIHFITFIYVNEVCVNILFTSLRIHIPNTINHNTSGQPQSIFQLA